MRASRRRFGRTAFWLGHLSVVAALALLGAGPGAVALALVTALVGCYAEVEEQGASIFVSACFAVLATLGTATLAVGAWVAKNKASALEVVRLEVQEVARRMTEYNPGVKINVESIVYQTPSLLAVILMLALAAGLIWENRAAALAKLPKADGIRDRLTEFRAPDACLWLTMAALLGAFGLRGKFPAIESVSANALNVLVALYFFQGLAVVAKAFEAFQVSVFWRGFWYVMIALQLHLIVSLLGFADFWCEFRRKLPRNRPFQTNNETE